MSVTYEPKKYGTEASKSSNDLSNQPKIKLYENRKDREYHDNMAELFAIIVSVERLEKAYVKDLVKAEDYTKACQVMIAKFKTIKDMLHDSVPNVEIFFKDFHLDCPAAKHRLLKIGVPATVEHGGSSHDSSKHTTYVAQCVQYFITAMDGLKLEITAIDQIQPFINDIVDALHKVPLKDYDGKAKMTQWLQTLNQMKASDELSEDQIRQLSFDLEVSYNSFYKSLQHV